MHVLLSLEQYDKLMTKVTCTCTNVAFQVDHNQLNILIV